MKKIVLLAAALLAAAASFAQSEYNYQKRSLFEQLPIRGNDIVFLGNSITDGGEWAELFNNRHVKNRGISADRSGWLLDRLDPIINGHPKKLFLMIGTTIWPSASRPKRSPPMSKNCSTVSPRSRRGRRSTCRASFP